MQNSEGPMRTKVGMLFLVRTTLNVYPSFYITAPNLAAASSLALSITLDHNRDARVTNVSEVSTPLLEIDNHSVYEGDAQ